MTLKSSVVSKLLAVGLLIAALMMAGGVGSAADPEKLCFTKKGLLLRVPGPPEYCTPFGVPDPCSCIPPLKAGE